MINEDILTELQLRPISDYWTREGLRNWLTENRIPFITAKNGWPRVHRKALEKAMGVESGELVKGEPAPVEFDFDALR